MEITPAEVQDTIHVFTEALMCISESENQASERTKKLIREKMAFFEGLRKSEVENG